MNGYERIRSALSGRPPDRVPVMLHNFMLAAREAGYTMEQFRGDPTKIADSFKRAVERYRYDAVVVDLDTATLAGALGVPVDFPLDQPARSHRGCLEDLEQVSVLPAVEVGNYRYVQTWLEAVRLLVDDFGDDIYIRGNCDQAPFSLASMVRTPELWFTDLLLDPDGAHRLLRYCTQASLQFIDLMAQTGAHMLSGGDSPAGPDLISPTMYQEFALPYEEQLITRSQASGLPYTLHICGNTDRILEPMKSTGVDAVEIDYKTDAALACRTLQGQTTFIGNLDPVGLLTSGTPAHVQAATEELLEIFAGNHRFILNAGCAIPPEAPSGNIEAMINATRA
jgi:uroporphyrinogen decarboxylase